MSATAKAVASTPATSHAPAPTFALDAADPGCHWIPTKINGSERSGVD
jgi:hypothetical protein